MKNIHKKIKYISFVVIALLFFGLSIVSNGTLYVLCNEGSIYRLDSYAAACLPGSSKKADCRKLKAYLDTCTPYVEYHENSGTSSKDVNYLTDPLLIFKGPTNLVRLLIGI